MASSTSQKALCATCGKIAGIFMCHGCTQNFCMQHANEHRQTLSKQMDEITLDHNLLKQTIAEQKIDSARHSLMKQIDEWETQSIDKIRRAAEDARKQLLNVVVEHTDNVTKALADLTQELKKARDDDD